MADRSPAAKPLRRRAIKLLSHWTARLKKEDRPAVYRALLAALAEEGDAAMQLVAVATLRALVDDWWVRGVQAAPFSTSIAHPEKASAELLVCMHCERQLQEFACTAGRTSQAVQFHTCPPPPCWCQ